MADEGYMPELDTGYGLIFRLNDLWNKVDREALKGSYDAWELTLDRIFSNLLYREEVEVEEDGENIRIKIVDDAYKQVKVIKARIRRAKRNKLAAYMKKNGTSISDAKIEHYNSLMFYDMWLRKFMHNELRLYMKESSSNPSMSMFGRTLKRKTR